MSWSSCVCAVFLTSQISPVLSVTHCTRISHLLSEITQRFQPTKQKSMKFPHSVSSQPSSALINPLTRALRQIGADWLLEKRTLKNKKKLVPLIMSLTFFPVRKVTVFYTCDLTLDIDSYRFYIRSPSSHTLQSFILIFTGALQLTEQQENMKMVWSQMKVLAG